MPPSAPSLYLFSRQKIFFDYLLSFLLLILLSPLFVLIGLLIFLSSGLPILFTQQRLGKNSRSFTIYKFRTMKSTAHRSQWRYQHLNLADGPVFKIADDPRFTHFGRHLARTGFDELPQLINILKGDMSLIGPRPLPIKEARAIPKKYQSRHLIKPGLTSPWVAAGAYHHNFTSWMLSDLTYLKSASLKQDLRLILSTTKFILRLVLSSFHAQAT